MYEVRDSCRACDGERLESFLGLGHTPLANSFLRSPAEFSDERRFRLEVSRCLDCSLVQLRDVIAPEVLFRDYIYVTGTSDTMRAHFDAYAKSVVVQAELGVEDLVVEVASNDGSLLRAFGTHGVRTLGIEPARNVADLARASGIETVSEFFDADLARKLRAERGPAAVVVANNVLAHVDDPKDFLTGCAEWIGESGRVVVEVPYLARLLEGVEYDTIYHEHLCYFSVIALLRLYEGAGLRIERVEQVAVHGGSLRITAGLASALPQHGETALALAAEERAAGLAGPEVYSRFAQAVERSREALLRLLSELRGGGARIAGYGAPAKGNTLLNYCGVSTDLLEYVVDRSPHKLGLYCPGSHLQVKAVSLLQDDPPDYLLILAWNFAEEIMQQQADYAAQGGRFILPLPQARVLGQ